MSDRPKPASPHQSLRTQVRMGGLRRSERPESEGELEAREPEELFADDEADGFVTFSQDEEVTVD